MNYQFIKSSFVIVLFFVNATVYAQAVASDAGVIFLYPNETNSTLSNVRRGAFGGSHDLGEEISTKLNEFEKTFVYYKKSQGAYATEEKIVLKPAIYKSIKKMDKYYSKKALESPTAITDITAKYNSLLDIGIKLMKYNTTQVESRLKKIKDPAEIEKYFFSLSFR